MDAYLPGCGMMHEAFDSTRRFVTFDEHLKLLRVRSYQSETMSMI